MTSRVGGEAVRNEGELATVVSDEDGHPLETLALLFDQLSLGHRYDRATLLEALMLARGQAGASPDNITLQNAASFLEAMVHQGNWLLRNAVRANFRWFAVALRSEIDEGRRQATSDEK